MASGWIAATTLFDYHFDPDTNELTRSGELHLRWILENAPEPHRIAFVQTGETPEVSQDRLASVQQLSAELVHGQSVPPIMLRVTSPLGRPADEILNIHRTELATQPEPRILYTPLPTGVSGSN